MRLIGDKIRERREELDLTVQGLANLVGVSKNTVHSWETGAGFNSGKYGDRLCQALRVTLKDLLVDSSAGSAVPPPPPLREQQKQYKKQEITTLKTRPIDFSLPEAMGMVTRILTSGTSYATALYLNIQHFDRAIMAENRICFLEQENIILREKIDHLDARLAALEKLSRDAVAEPAETGQVEAPTGTEGT